MVPQESQTTRPQTTYLPVRPRNLTQIPKMAVFKIESLFPSHRSDNMFSRHDIVSLQLWRDYNLRNNQSSKSQKNLPQIVFPTFQTSSHHHFGYALVSMLARNWAKTTIFQQRWNVSLLEDLSAVLYPNDATYEGKELRLRQQLLGCKRNCRNEKKVGNKWEEFNIGFGNILLMISWG